MTVWKTSMRNFFAHKGRMALSAVAVLLSVGFVCGTLVFTDTMNTTFDKLFAATAADVTVSPKSAKGTDNSTQNGKPESLPASAVRQVEKADGVRSARGGVSSMSVTVVDGHNKDVGSSSGAPTIMRQLDARRDQVDGDHLRPRAARPLRGDGRRGHREEAPPHAGRRAAHDHRQR